MRAVFLYKRPDFESCKFNTHEQDKTGLTYFNARYYDSDTGRFITPDPTIPDPTNSQAFNRYMFVYGNPISLIDANGFSESESGNNAAASETSGEGDTSGESGESTNTSANVGIGAAIGAVVGAIAGFCIGGVPGAVAGAAFGSQFGIVGGAISSAPAGYFGAVGGLAVAQFKDDKENIALYKAKLRYMQKDTWGKTNITLNKTDIVELSKLAKKFKQWDWSKYSYNFRAHACFTTAIVNELSEEYTIQKGEIMTEELAYEMLDEVVGKSIRKSDACVIGDKADVANAMWAATNCEGTWSYSVSSDSNSIGQHSIISVTTERGFHFMNTAVNSLESLMNNDCIYNVGVRETDPYRSLSDYSGRLNHDNAYRNFTFED